MVYKQSGLSMDLKFHLLVQLGLQVNEHLPLLIESPLVGDVQPVHFAWFTLVAH